VFMAKFQMSLIPTTKMPLSLSNYFLINGLLNISLNT
jgi:multidrug efflux pump subunit AcrB